MQKVESWKKNSCIAFDGSWSHRRNANHFLLDFIDIRSGKVVDFQILSKLGNKNERDEGPSNCMEAEELKLMIPRWKDDRRVTQYVHDKDSKTKKAIEEAGLNIEEMIDTNHCVKSFRCKFNRIKVKSPTKLNGLKAPLERFFQALLKIDLTIEEKQDLWLNAVEHFSVNHEKCMKHVACKHWSGISIGNSMEVLEEFLDKTRELLAKYDNKHSTQMCESLHGMKAHLANKNLCWKSSWGARICCVILSVNEYKWEFDLYNRLGLPPLSFESKNEPK